MFPATYTIRPNETEAQLVSQQLTAFENALAAYWGLRHCAGVASGLDSPLDAVG